VRHFPAFSTTMSRPTALWIRRLARIGFLRGGGGDDDPIVAPLLVDTTRALVEGACGWCVNLGAPPALIAGAAVATLYENSCVPAAVVCYFCDLEFGMIR
jgi:hypothetical protein